jgi:2-iminobutanoate/2-iminopropanoate deaminase
MRIRFLIERSVLFAVTVLEAAGSDLSKVVKTTVLLADMAFYPVVNSIYAEYFPTAPPARAAYAALVRERAARAIPLSDHTQGLPAGAKVEIEAIALTSRL